MTTPESQLTKRPSCARCLRPLSTCLCKHIHTVNNLVELIILQHPLEVNEAKNTARLLHLCLNNSQLHIGERFDSDFFARFNLAATNTTNTERYDVLLYPETPEEKSLGIASPPALDVERLNLEALNLEAINLEAINLRELNNGNLATGYNLNKNSRIRLWVLDATWRKSRKMLYLNQVLQTMPRLKLHSCAPTIYTIRKAHSENQLSTLEASCYALQQLEQNIIDYTPLLQAFTDFVAQQKTFLPTSHS